MNGDLAGKEAQGRLLRQVQEVLPGYGDGFLAACLDAAGQDAERVIHQLLEGTLPGWRGSLCGSTVHSHLDKPNLQEDLCEFIGRWNTEEPAKVLMTS